MQGGARAGASLSSEDWACKQRLESRYASNATHLPRAPRIASQRTVHGNAPLPIPTDCRNGLRTDPYLDLLAPAPADPSGPEPKKRTDVRDEAVNRRHLAEYQAAHEIFTGRVRRLGPDEAERMIPCACFWVLAMAIPHVVKIPNSMHVLIHLHALQTVLFSPHWGTHLTLAMAIGKLSGFAAQAAPRRRCPEALPTGSVRNRTGPRESRRHAA